jgi:hypothetical protein
MSQRRMKIPEALRGAYAAARAARWEVTRTGGGHLKWAPPRGQFVITPGSPSAGHRAVRNCLSDLRRAGLQC